MDTEVKKSRRQILLEKICEKQDIEFMEDAYVEFLDNLTINELEGIVRNLEETNVDEV